MLISPEASSRMWQAICRLIVLLACVCVCECVSVWVRVQRQYADRCVALAAHLRGQSTSQVQHGAVVGKKEWSHPCCGQPLFPTLFLPFQGWPRWPDRRKIHPLGGLLWCCDATSPPARQLDWGTTPG